MSATAPASSRSPSPRRSDGPSGPAGPLEFLTICPDGWPVVHGRRGAGPMMDGIADRRTFGTGDTIFREGDRGEGIYLVEKGSVEIFKKAPDGRKVVIGKI